jgi:hypothetical protein
MIEIVRRNEREMKECERKYRYDERETESKMGERQRKSDGMNERES